MTLTRIESDSFGDIAVPVDRLWGAQTQRSIQTFPIQPARFQMPIAIVRAFGVLKLAAARTNASLGEISEETAALVMAAAARVISGELDDHFPLVVFQTGSGTQSNMNANEVMAACANELAGGRRGDKSPVHPNDHVNRGQSSNDTFPTAMHIAVVEELHSRFYPALAHLLETLRKKAATFADVVKTGRTHLQDATPITLGQEIGAWAAQLEAATAHVRACEKTVLELAIGGTAVGTGLNAHPQFGDMAAAEIARLTGHAFVSAPNKFAALAAHDGLVNMSAALRALAGAAMKMANDVRLLASGPRCGIGELLIPENEPGSSIMPGKVNPTQCEALTMVCVQVFGNDAAVAFAGTQGHLQLNVYKPVMAHNVLESIALLADSLAAFDLHCASGIEPNRSRIAENLDRNLMLVTALNRHIGYDKSAAIAKAAHKQGLDLRSAAIRSGDVSAADFDRWVVPLDMTHS